MFFLMRIGNIALGYRTELASLIGTFTLEIFPSTIRKFSDYYIKVVSFFQAKILAVFQLVTYLLH